MDVPVIIVASMIEGSNWEMSKRVPLHRPSFWLMFLNNMTGVLSFLDHLNLVCPICHFQYLVSIVRNLLLAMYQLVAV